MSDEIISIIVINRRIERLRDMVERYQGDENIGKTKLTKWQAGCLKTHPPPQG